MFIDDFKKHKKISSCKWKRFRNIEKRFRYYRELISFSEKYSIDYIYIRYHLSDPAFLYFLKKCSMNKIKIYIEIPTYPYDKELNNIILTIDKVFRNKIKKYVDILSTYSKHDSIYGIPTIKIENGIDIDLIPIVKTKKTANKDKINLIVVANFSYWHGYDRLIKGLHEYYNMSNNVKVYINMVGEGKELLNLKNIVNELKLNAYVIFHGVKIGNDLNNLFNASDIAIASLGNHRKGLLNDSALKNREYCSRGVPFVIASLDNSFKNNCRYIYKVPSDESSIDIIKLLNFYEGIKNENFNEILRRFAEKNLTWDVKLKPIIENIYKNL